MSIVSFLSLALMGAAFVALHIADHPAVRSRQFRHAVWCCGAALLLFFLGHAAAALANAVAAETGFVRSSSESARALAVIALFSAFAEVAVLLPVVIAAFKLFAGLRWTSAELPRSDDPVRTIHWVAGVLGHMAARNRSFDAWHGFCAYRFAHPELEAFRRRCAVIDRECRSPEFSDYLSAEGIERLAAVVRDANGLAAGG